MNDGTGVTRLTNNTVPDKWPAWSPTFWIAFASSSHIYVMNPDGSGATELAQSLGWSPRARRKQDRVHESARHNFDVFVMNADGGVTRPTYGAGLDNRQPMAQRTASRARSKLP
jgi:Tol biopolymer transport system component